MTLSTMPSFKNDFQFNVGAKKPIQTTKSDLQTPKNTSKEFSKMFQTSLNEAKPKATESEMTDEKAPLSDIVEATTLEEALELLDIPVDGTAQFVEIEQQLIPVDELLSTENLAAIVELPIEQLQQTIQQLNPEVEATDIWSIVEAAPQLLEQLSAKLETEQLTEPEEKLVQLLKLVQLVGQSSETNYTQQVQLEDLQQVFVKLSAELQQVVGQQLNQQTSQQVVTTPVPQMTQVETKVEAVQSSSNNSAQNESLLNQSAQPTVSSTIKTVNVTLPSNPTSQAEALAKEVAQLMAKSQMTQGTGNIKLMLKLFPENLGQIRIEIFQQNGIISARLLASTPLGKDLIESSMNQLKTALVSQNVQVDRIDVAAALQETDKNFRDQSFLNQSFNQREQEKNEEEQVEQEEQKTFTELLTEEVEQNDNNLE